MRVLNPLADLHEQLQALANRKPDAVAVLCDWNPRDVLHYKERPSFRSGASIEYSRDCGMIHHRQGLPLGLEAGDNLASVHTQLDDFDRDLPANGLLLLGLPHFAHDAFADLL